MDLKEIRCEDVDWIPLTPDNKLLKTVIYVRSSWW
jgi:hypothetical protein